MHKKKRIPMLDQVQNTQVHKAVNEARTGGNCYYTYAISLRRYVLWLCNKMYLLICADKHSPVTSILHLHQ